MDHAPKGDHRRAEGPHSDVLGRVKPSDAGSCAIPLYPWVDKEWGPSNSRNATVGAVRAALTRIEKEFASQTNPAAKSPMAWYSALAKQLLYSREDREKLGPWDPRSLMPDLYDRATCAAELRLRDEISDKIRGGEAAGRPI